MKLELTLLRTRVARRMLALFLVCAVVPVIVLGGVAYWFVADSITSAVQRELHQDGNLAGQLVLGRLEELAAQLKTRQAASAPSPAAAAGGGSLEGVAMERENGQLVPIDGKLPPPPVLSASQLAQLGTGRPVLVVTNTLGPRGLYLVVPGGGIGGNGYPRTWGFATVERAMNGLEAVRDGTQMCLRDIDGPLTCSGDGSPGATAIARTNPPAQVASGDTASHAVFLKYEFAARPWTLVLTKRDGDALAPLVAFRRVFLLGLLFAVLLVFTLSHVQIRQRMSPLADLEAGTRRLRAGDFSTRVHVDSDDEFQSLAGSFNRMATDLERQFATLSALRQVDQAALQHRTVAAIATAALQAAPKLLDARAVALATGGPDDGTGWHVEIVTAGESGSRGSDIEASRAEIAELGAIADYLPVGADQLWPGYCRALLNHGCGQFVVFPIHGQGRVIGALIAGFAAGSSSSPELFGTGRQLADQLALGLSNVSLLEELDAMSVGALTALARTVDAASHWTSGHSERVTTHAVEIGRRLGLDDVSLSRLHQGGLLHDIGKIGVPTAVLDKPGPLNEEELLMMQSHPAIGADIVQSVRAFRELVPLVLHHHELLDGSGYPSQLRGAEISDLVRILTVADVYDALVSNRPYRDGLGADVALGILHQEAGTKFDARAVDALREMVVAGWAPSRRSDIVPGVDLSEPDRRLLIGAGFKAHAA